MSGTRTTGNWWLLGEGELASPRDEPPCWLPNVEWLAIKPHRHQQQKWAQQIFLCMCMYAFTCINTYVCVCVTIIINGKKTIKLKMGKTREMSNVGCLGGVGGRKGKGERDVLLFQLQNKNVRIYYSCGVHSGLFLLECSGNLSKHSEKQASHQPLVQLWVISSFRGHQRHTEKEDQRLSTSKLATPSWSCCLIPQPTWLFPTRWTSNFTCSVGKQEGEYSRDSRG